MNNNKLSDRQKELAYARQHRIDPGSPCERCKAPACPMVCRPKHDWEVRKYLRETKQGGFDKK